MLMEPGMSCSGTAAVSDGGEWGPQSIPLPAGDGALRSLNKRGDAWIMVIQAFLEHRGFVYASQPLSLGVLLPSLPSPGVLALVGDAGGSHQGGLRSGGPRCPGWGEVG